MSRSSTVQVRHDAAGDYEAEIFDCPQPERIIVCLHGRGVRRWDGKKFFYAIAKHYADSAVLLADQFQHDGDTIILTPLPLIVARINDLITTAKQLHPNTPIVAVAHSMGCGVATFIDTTDLEAMALVTPAAGDAISSYIERYGPDIVKGMVVRNHEGAAVDFTAEFVASMQGIFWPDRYRDLVKRFEPTYVFEGGKDEIIGEVRKDLRGIPFTRYMILNEGTHNLSGAPLADLFAKLDPLLST